MPREVVGNVVTVTWHFRYVSSRCALRDTATSFFLAPSVVTFCYLDSQLFNNGVSYDT